MVAYLDMECETAKPLLDADVRDVSMRKRLAHISE
jgi:hypothetical protein